MRVSITLMPLLRQAGSPDRLTVQHLQKEGELMRKMFLHYLTQYFALSPIDWHLIMARNHD